MIAPELSIASYWRRRGHIATIDAISRVGIPSWCTECMQAHSEGRSEICAGDIFLLMEYGTDRTAREYFRRVTLQKGFPPR